MKLFIKCILFLIVISVPVDFVRAQEGYLQAPAKKAVSSPEKEDSFLLDSLMMRIQDLEERVRVLTGELETANMTLEDESKKVEKVNSDNNIRFKDLEEKMRKQDQEFKKISKIVTDRIKAEAAEKKRQQQEAAKAKSDKEKAAQYKADFSKMTPKQLYDSAFVALKKPDYPQAEKRFEAFVLLYPKNALAGNAQYWLGESFYARGSYEDAAVAFANGFKNYRQSQKAPDNLLKLGLTMAALKKKNEACIAFKNFAKEYPKVPDAMKKRLASEAKKLKCS